MSRVFTKTSAEYLTYEGLTGVTLLCTYPYTWGIWYKSNSAGAAQTLFSANALADDFVNLRLQLRGDKPTKPVKGAHENGSGTQDEIDTTTSYATAAWETAMYVCTSSTNRTVYRNGGSSASTTNLVTQVTTAARLSIGLNRKISPTHPHSGLVAYGCAWAGTLNATQISDFAAGRHPATIGTLISCWPLIGDTNPERDYISGYDMVVTGVGFNLSDQPPVDAAPPGFFNPLPPDPGPGIVHRIQKRQF